MISDSVAVQIVTVNPAFLTTPEFTLVIEGAGNNIAIFHQTDGVQTLVPEAAYSIAIGASTVITIDTVAYPLEDDDILATVRDELFVQQFSNSSIPGLEDALDTIIKEIQQVKVDSDRSLKAIHGQEPDDYDYGMLTVDWDGKVVAYQVDGTPASINTSDLTDAIAALGQMTMIIDAVNGLNDDVVVHEQRIDAHDAQIAQKQDILTFTPERTSNKNIANGYAGLDSSGEIIKALASDALKNGVIITTSETGFDYTDITLPDSYILIETLEGGLNVYSVVDQIPTLLMRRITTTFSTLTNLKPDNFEYENGWFSIEDDDSIYALFGDTLQDNILFYGEYGEFPIVTQAFGESIYWDKTTDTWKKGDGSEIYGGDSLSYNFGAGGVRPQQLIFYYDGDAYHYHHGYDQGDGEYQINMKIKTSLSDSGSTSKQLTFPTSPGSPLNLATTIEVNGRLPRVFVYELDSSAGIFETIGSGTAIDLIQTPIYAPGTDRRILSISGGTKAGASFAVIEDETVSGVKRIFSDNIDTGESFEIGNQDLYDYLAISSSRAAYKFYYVGENESGDRFWAMSIALYEADGNTWSLETTLYNENGLSSYRTSTANGVISGVEQLPPPALYIADGPDFYLYIDGEKLAYKVSDTIDWAQIDNVPDFAPGPDTETRLGDLETDTHTHSNKTLLDTIVTDSLLSPSERVRLIHHLPDIAEELALSSSDQVAFNLAFPLQSGGVDQVSKALRNLLASVSGLPTIAFTTDDVAVLDPLKSMFEFFGFVSPIDNLGQLLDSVGQHLTGINVALGDFFTAISDNGDDITALDLRVTANELLIDGLDSSALEARIVVNETDIGLLGTQVAAIEDDVTPRKVVMMYDGGDWVDNVTWPGWYACVAANAAQGCPDMVGRMPIGKIIAGAGSPSSGTGSVTLQESNMPTHNHGVTAEAGSLVTTADAHLHQVTGTVDPHVHYISLTTSIDAHYHGITGGSHSHSYNTAVTSTGSGYAASGGTYEGSNNVNSSSAHTHTCAQDSHSHTLTGDTQGATSSYFSTFSESDQHDHSIAKLEIAGAFTIDDAGSSAAIDLMANLPTYEFLYIKKVA